MVIAEIEKDCCRDPMEDGKRYRPDTGTNSPVRLTVGEAEEVCTD